MSPSIRQKFSALFFASFFVSTFALAADPFDIGTRKLVDMPPPVEPVIRGEMVDLLGAMRQVFALSGEGKYFEAGTLAEKLIGRSAMGMHGGNIRPGMFMPPEMRALAQTLHQNGSDWSFALRTGDRQRADLAFAQLMGTCAACHQSFQLKRY